MAAESATPLYGRDKKLTAEFESTSSHLDSIVEIKRGQPEFNLG